jgi:hypothetical protein
VFKRVRGFLLIEAFIFVLIIFVGFLALINLNMKLIDNQGYMFQESISQMHVIPLTSSCSPGHEDSFPDYCRRNNIIITKNSKFGATVQINKELYEIKIHNGNWKMNKVKN